MSYAECGCCGQPCNEWCDECGCCWDCCECDCDPESFAELFDADELGLDPELDDTRRYP